MPATESLLHSQGVCLTYPLKTGGSVEIRCGCVVDPVTRKTLCGSDGAADWVLSHCRLTADQRGEVEWKYRFVWPAASVMSGDRRFLQDRH